MTDENSVKELEAFVADPQLEQLETALTRFNIFQAIGARDREVCHSDFLAYLLDPEQNHGLGDAFLKLFLRKALRDPADADSFDHGLCHDAPSIADSALGAPVDADWFAHTTVRREYRYIDILIEDEQDEVVVIIENKVWSPEGKDQLCFYWKTMQHEHPKWRIYGVYLTPSGQDPSCKCYNALSYRAVMPMLEEVLRARRGQLAAGVELVIRDYLDLWRSILGNTEAETLARRLYSRHHPALELMNKAPWRKSIKAYLRDLIKECGLLRAENKPTEYIHFTVTAWDGAMGKGSAYPDLPLLYFGFYNLADSLTLYLTLQPGSPEEVRKQIVSLVEQTGSPFHKPKNSSGGWAQLYDQSFLAPKDYEKYSDDGLMAAIDKEWQKFVEQSLPAIAETFRRQDWFWPGGDTRESP